MTGEPSPIQWVGPLPPLRTGIAGYCQDILTAVDGLWPVGLYLESGANAGNFKSIGPARRKLPDPRLPTIIQVGNSEHHERAYQAATLGGGILVLHDVVLHHSILGRYVRKGAAKEYWAQLERRYGEDGVNVGRSILAGRDVADLQQFPLSERFIEAARLVVVHSKYAEDQVRKHVPGAIILRVPMGLPLPALIPRELARDQLGMRSSDFLVASITHVNPNKRLPVVLRAIRRLASRVPETRLVIAGSGSDSPDLRREIRLLGLGQRVTTWGYVDDRTSRLLAAAADVCVNLRYPSTGETSASLLRLLAAGKAVIVSDDGAGSELPDQIAFKVEPDGLEVDIIEETLFELAMNPTLRTAAGEAAREWVRENHSMGVAVDGYRRAIAAAYGIELPGLVDPVVNEPLHEVAPSEAQEISSVPSLVGTMVGDAIYELGLSPQSPILRDAALAMAELRLHQTGYRQSIEPPPAAPQLVDRLQCPSCGGDVMDDKTVLRCPSCGGVAAISEGVPDFLQSMNMMREN